jgi:hypothetical protein
MNSKGGYSMKLSRTIIIHLLFLSCAFAANQTIVNLPVNSWYQCANTHLNSVAPAGWGANVMVAWSGGAFDTKRNWLYIFGGGHNDYDGNELYAFQVDSLNWRRLTDPTPKGSINYCSAQNADGTPNSRHTYNGLAYIAHADRFFVDGGCPACPGGGCGLKGAFTFDPAGKVWSLRNPSGTPPPTDCENACVYDAVTKKVFWADGSSSGPGLYSFDYDGNAWAKLNSTVDQWGRTGTIDTKRKLLIYVGRGNVYVYDIGNSNYTMQSWSTSGGSSLVAPQSPGIAYDPVSDRIVGFCGGSVYALNPDTKVWTAYSASGAPSATASGGVYGRWRYVPDCNAFVFVNAIDQNVYFYKLTTGGGTPSERPAPLSGARSGNGSIRVCDINGRLVARGHAPGFRFDTRGVPAGLYLIKEAGKKAYVSAIVR